MRRCKCMCLFDQLRGGWRRSLVQRREGRVPFGHGHHRLQAPLLGIEVEQGLGQLRLHAEHVDEKTQRAEVVGQTLEDARLRQMLRVDLGGRELVDGVVHVHDGARCLL